MRFASLADLDGICAIENDSFSSPYPRFLIERLLRDRRGVFFVATHEKEGIIAYCVSSMSGRSGHLISLAVLRGCRRMGVATALMEKLLASSMEQGAEEVWLEVNLENEAAIRLYSRFGFEKEMTMRNYYSDGSPALRMRLDLRKSRAESSRTETSRK